MFDIVQFFFFRSSPVHIFGNSNSLHSYARPPLASSAPNPSRGHLRERRRVRVTFHFQPQPEKPRIIRSPQLRGEIFMMCTLTWFIFTFIIYNRLAVNPSLESSRCPHHFLTMKTWPGLIPGPQQPGIASLKVHTYTVISVTHVEVNTEHLK